MHFLAQLEFSLAIQLFIHSQKGVIYQELAYDLTDREEQNKAVTLTYYDHINIKYKVGMTIDLKIIKQVEGTKL